MKMESDLSSLSITPLEEQEQEQEQEEFDEEFDEEEDDELQVQLGFLEKPTNPRFLLRHFFPSKAGGAPAWLNPVNLPSEKSRSCGFCGEPLHFLLQIYASIDGQESTFHRTLYVFMCPSMPCLLRDQHEQWRHKEAAPLRSVKVFRCQLPRSNPFYSSIPPKLDGTDRPLSAGAPLCCWCGTWKGDKLCSDCKKARYCSQKHQSMHWNSGHKEECRKLAAPDSPIVNNGNDIEDHTVSKSGLSKAMWPDYEIVIEEECGFESEKSVGSSSAVGSSAIVTKCNKTDEALQSVMDQFEADADKRSWASFQERISRAPEQVLRYCRDAMAKPLWPFSSGRPSKADIPPCGYCKGPLCYEFQIMPQLLYYFGVKNDKSSLDWETITVYTCSASCESSISYKEEFNFRLAQLRGFRRVFAHVAPFFFERGIANAQTETGEISSLSVEPCQAQFLIVTVFEISTQELPAFLHREQEFRFLAVFPQGLDGIPFPNRAVLCARYSDEEYFQIRCQGSKEIYHERYGRSNIHKIWRDDILPCRIYLRHCVLAAKNLGEEAYNNFLNHTYISDRKTTIRQYLATAGAGIMEEEPPESLKTRYGG